MFIHSGFFSVALAWESPPPDVIRHPALRSPDFPHLLTQPRSSVLLTNMLHVKITAANKLSTDRVIGHYLGIKSYKILKELKKSLCFIVFWILFGNLK